MMMKPVKLANGNGDNPSRYVYRDIERLIIISKPKLMINLPKHVLIIDEHFTNIFYLISY